jgi:hypothetical protein
MKNNKFVTFDNVVEKFINYHESNALSLLVNIFTFDISTSLYHDLLLCSSNIFSPSPGWPCCAFVAASYSMKMDYYACFIIICTNR